MHQKNSLASLCSLLTVLLVHPLAATTVETISFEQAVERSSAIVHGQVVRSRVAWDPERTTLWTHYDIRVEDQLKGRRVATLTISEPGGELDGQHMQVVGAPHYEIGEEVVVFAARTPIGYLRTCGWEQGKFLVEGGAVRSKGSAGPAQSVSSQSGADLEGFLSRIRAEVARQDR